GEQPMYPSPSKNPAAHARSSSLSPPPRDVVSMSVSQTVNRRYRIPGDSPRFTSKTWTPLSTRPFSRIAYPVRVPRSRARMPVTVPPWRCGAGATSSANVVSPALTGRRAWGRACLRAAEVLHARGGHRMNARDVRHHVLDAAHANSPSNAPRMRLYFNGGRGFGFSSMADRDGAMPPTM